MGYLHCWFKTIFHPSIMHISWLLAQLIQVTFSKTKLNYMPDLTLCLHFMYLLFTHRLYWYDFEDVCLRINRACNVIMKIWWKIL